MPKRERVEWELTVEYEYDPHAVNRALRAWTDFLADHVKQQAKARARLRRADQDHTA